MMHEKNMSAVFKVPHEGVTPGCRDGEAIFSMEYLCHSLESIIEEFRNNSCNVSPETLEVLRSGSRKLDELMSSIAEEKGRDNGDSTALKIRMMNPSVCVEDYDGPICLLKSMWRDDKPFSINLRFDISSFSDLHKFVDYFTDLMEKRGTMNMPFVKNRYRMNLEVEFSNPAIVDDELF